MKPITKAKKWLMQQPRFVKSTSAHPSHCVMSLCDDNGNVKNRRGNVWISAEISLLVYSTGEVRLGIWGIRTGPEARSTCDGPIEMSYNIGTSVNVEWVNSFDDAAFEEVKRLVTEHAPKLLEAYDATVKEYL